MEIDANNGYLVFIGYERCQILLNYNKNIPLKELMQGYQGRSINQKAKLVLITG